MYGVAARAFVILPPRAVDEIKFGTVLRCIVFAGALWLCGCIQCIFRIVKLVLIMVACVVAVSSPDGHLRDAAGVSIVIAAHWVSGSL